MTRPKKPKPQAYLRTVDMFTGKTVLDEAEAVAREEDPFADARERRGDMVEGAEKTAVRWLGLDAFTVGDDVKIALGKSGQAVLILVRVGPDGTPCSTATIKLSPKQWNKLRDIARNA